MSTVSSREIHQEEDCAIEDDSLFHAAQGRLCQVQAALGHY